MALAQIGRSGSDKELFSDSEKTFAAKINKQVQN